MVSSVGTTRNLLAFTIEVESRSGTAQHGKLHRKMQFHRLFLSTITAPSHYTNG